jgi:hypothetical protein
MHFSRIINFTGYVKILFPRGVDGGALPPTPPCRDRSGRCILFIYNLTVIAEVILIWWVRGNPPRGIYGKEYESALSLGDQRGAR